MSPKRSTAAPRKKAFWLAKKKKLNHVQKTFLDRLFSQCRTCDKLNEILSLSFRALCAHMHEVKTKLEGTVPGVRIITLRTSLTIEQKG